jgi:ATP-dependent helicase/nuclease subunit B
MMLTYYTGRARRVRGALFDVLRGLMGEGDRPVVLIVPAQYTLEAELDIIDALGLSGSFRLQVLSPQRFYQRIFDEAGRPAPVRIDEQGRVMLLQRAALSLGEKLKWYRRAVSRPGFAERAVRQIAQFKQAGLSPQDVGALGAAEPGALGRKLADISALFDAYEQSLLGRFLDGEDEAREAVLRMDQSSIARGDMVFYGFDLISPTLARTIAALCGCARSVSLFLTLENSGNAPDFSVYLPVQHAFDRLNRLIVRQDLPWRRVRLEDEAPPGGAGALRHLERSLYCWPFERYQGAPEGLTVSALANPQDEAEFAAAMIRNLAMERGWRYRDMMVACQTLDETMIFALNRAFEMYDVPLFLSQSRPALRHPLSRCLLSALKLAGAGFRPDDIAGYVRSGFAPLSDDEADRLMNYAQAFGLRGSAWMRPLERGDAETLAELEGVRARLVAPIQALKQRARGASAAQLLEAAFLFLEEIGARQRLEAQQKTLTDMGRREWAMEGAQVWNKIIQALDQAHELMADQPMSLRALYELLRRALGAAEVKALPQSGDAVMGGGLDHMKGRPVKALFILGASDMPPGEGGALLADRELARLAERQVWLGLRAEDRSRMLRLNVKNMLALCSELVFVSYPRSDMAGAALKPGPLVQLLHRLFPALRERGGVANVAEKRLRLGAPEAALARASALLRADPSDPDARAALAVLGSLPEYAPAVARLSRAFSHRVGSDPLPPPLRAAPAEVGISRLERFIACPFKDFVSSCLRPEEIREFDLSARDAGNFYHAALEQFARENELSLTGMTDEEAVKRMDGISEKLLEDLARRAIGESAVQQREGRRIADVACRAAQTLVGHMAGSRFAPVALEVQFGLEDARVLLREGALSGRIDRIDAWDSDGERYLRVIDYKTRGRALSLTEVYYGLQLQLVLYLAAALSRGGKPAGVFYFAVDDPLIDSPSLDPQQIQAQREKALKLDGLTLDDARVVEAMSPRPEAVLGITAGPSGLKGGRLVTQRDFMRLKDHAVGLADDALCRIRAGDTAIRPYQLGAAKACDLCDFRPICQFSAELPGASVRRLPPIPARDVLGRLRADAPPEDGEP